MLHRSLAQTARSAARPARFAPSLLAAPPRRASPLAPPPSSLAPHTTADSCPCTVARGYAEPAPTGQFKATSETSGPHQTIPHAPPKPTPFFARKNIGLEVTPLMAFIGTVRSLSPSLSLARGRARERRATSPLYVGLTRSLPLLLALADCRRRDGLPRQELCVHLSLPPSELVLTLSCARSDHRRLGPSASLAPSCVARSRRTTLVLRGCRPWLTLSLVLPRRSSTVTASTMTRA